MPSNNLYISKPPDMLKCWNGSIKAYIVELFFSIHHGHSLKGLLSIYRPDFPNEWAILNFLWHNLSLLYAPTALGGTLFSLACMFCLPSFLALVVCLGDKYLVVCSIKVLKDMLTFSTSLSSPMSSPFPASLIFSSCIFESPTLLCLLLYQLYFPLVDSQYHFFPVYCPHYPVFWTLSSMWCSICVKDTSSPSLLLYSSFLATLEISSGGFSCISVLLLHPDVQLLKFQCPVSLLVPSVLIFPLYFDRLFAVYLSPPYFFCLLIST